MTAVVAFAILELQTRGHRKFELAITGFLGIVFLGFMYDLLQVGVDPARSPRAWSRTSTAPTASCWPSASSARR